MHLRSLLFSGLFLPVLGMLAQTSSQFAAVQVSATVQKAPASITLSWTALPNTSSITIYRKAAAGTSWGNAIASPAASSTTWTDNTVALATAYEYKVVRVANGTWAFHWKKVKHSNFAMLTVIQLTVCSFRVQQLAFRVQRFGAFRWVAELGVIGQPRHLCLNGLTVNPTATKRLVRT